LRPRPCIIHAFRYSNKVIVPRRRLKPHQRARPHEPPIDIRLKIGLILAGLMSPPRFTRPSRISASPPIVPYYDLLAVEAIRPDRDNLESKLARW
jgi:hypothetical protein